MNIGQEVTQMREDLGWTQARLAGLAGVDQSTISMLETGKTPSAKTTRKLEQAFGLPDGYWTYATPE